MMMSPGDRCGTSSSMKSSTGLPALTSIITRRGYFEFGNHFFNRMRAEHFRALGLVREKMIHLFRGAVVGDDGEAVVVHVENEILAHHGQPDQCDVSLWFHIKFS